MLAEDACLLLELECFVDGAEFQFPVLAAAKANLQPLVVLLAKVGRPHELKHLQGGPVALLPADLGGLVPLVEGDDHFTLELGVLVGAFSHSHGVRDS